MHPEHLIGGESTVTYVSQAAVRERPMRSTRLETMGLLRHATLRLPGGREGILRTKRGSGGFGDVWEVMDAESGQRSIAKFPRVFADAGRSVSAETSIIREGRMLESLRIPGVPPLLGWGERDGQPFLLLPLIEGTTWRTVLRTRRRCDDREWLARTAELAGILADLHAERIVHGDVKPGNILFGRRPMEKPRTWLIDFGLASHIDDIRNNARHRGATLGTGGYLDPRLIGHGHERDCAGDVYALGVMLYEGYTWSPLFCRQEWSAIVSCMQENSGEALKAATGIVDAKTLRFDAVPERLPALETLIKDILSRDNRPTATEVALSIRAIARADQRTDA